MKGFDNSAGRLVDATTAEPTESDFCQKKKIIWVAEVYNVGVRPNKETTLFVSGIQIYIFIVGLHVSTL